MGTNLAMMQIDSFHVFLRSVEVCFVHQGSQQKVAKGGGRENCRGFKFESLREKPQQVEKE
jgi:hypothetical protein